MKLYTVILTKTAKNMETKAEVIKTCITNYEAKHALVENVEKTLGRKIPTPQENGEYSIIFTSTNIRYCWHIKEIEYDQYPSIVPSENNPLKVYFGEEAIIRLPKDKHVYLDAIEDCFDELEYDCWKLIKSYMATFDCKQITEETSTDEEEPLIDDISFDLAKHLQNEIIKMFRKAGIVFIDHFGHEV